MPDTESEIRNPKSETGHTFAQKALARAAGLDHAEIGQIVDARPDIVLSHDNTAAIARLFRGLGRDRVCCPERLAIVLDHAVPAPTAEHAQNHAEVRRFVAEQGIAHFFDAGRGICHQVLSEEALVLPGQLILGADSHTTHFGWLGAFGAGIGRSEVAALWATGELWLRVPETIRVDLTGSLPPGVTAKDLGLWLLKLLGPEAGIYRAVEIGGPGLRALSIESRMVLPNLLAESGAKNAYLEPDEAVFAWLASRLTVRSNGFSRSEHDGTTEVVTTNLAAGALYPDPDAAYIARYTVDLAMLEPAIAAPHNPANVVPLSDVAGTRIHQAFIGTCTNGRLEDLAAAAEALRGPDGRVRRVAAGTRLLVIPASSQVLQDALAAGYIETLLAAGAMLGTPGCGPCMGNHLGIPAAGETVISSANRNFRGRMGNPDAQIYLASPAVVAASAVLGRIPGVEDLNDWNRGCAIAPFRVSRSAAASAKPAKAAIPDQNDWDRGCAMAPFRVSRSPAASTKPAKASIPDQDDWDRSYSQPAASPTKPAEASIPEQEFAPNPQSAIRNPQSPIRNPQSAIRNPQSPIPNPQSAILSGRAWVYGDDVNTDVIFPGKYTYTIKDEAEMARHALEDLDPAFAANVRPGDIIVAGRNWGCGSSREQAVTCLRAAGIRVIIAASFARIYFRNAVNNGLLPIVCPEAVAAIQPEEHVTVDLSHCVVRCAAGEFAFPPFSASVAAILDAGGLLPMLRRDASRRDASR